MVDGTSCSVRRVEKNSQYTFLKKAAVDPGVKALCSLDKSLLSVTGWYMSNISSKD